MLQRVCRVLHKVGETAAGQRTLAEETQSRKAELQRIQADHRKDSRSSQEHEEPHGLHRQIHRRNPAAGQDQGKGLPTIRLPRRNRPDRRMINNSS